MLGCLTAVIALSGCTNRVNTGPPPVARIALGMGQEAAEVGTELAGVARAQIPHDRATRQTARTLWDRAVRLDAEIPGRLVPDAPGAAPLRSAAAELRVAAALLQGRRPRTTLAADHIGRAGSALRLAADRLAPRLPVSAEGGLEQMRTVPPPG